jgi:hypothetical protein
MMMGRDVFLPRLYRVASQKPNLEPAEQSGAEQSRALPSSTRTNRSIACSSGRSVAVITYNSLARSFRSGLPQLNQARDEHDEAFASCSAPIQAPGWAVAKLQQGHKGLLSALG